MKIKQMAVGPLGTNCYIIWNEETEQAVVLDPGGDAQRIQEQVKKLGVSVEAVLLTHGHFDHMLAADSVRQAYAVKIYIGEDDWELVQKPEENVSAMFGHPLSLQADEKVQDGQTLTLAGISFQVLATPGHTKGGVCYYVPKEKTVFCGDTVFQGSVGRTDFPTGSTSVLTRSIREKLLILPEDTNLLPGHGEATTVKFEKNHNMFLI